MSKHNAAKAHFKATNPDTHVSVTKAATMLGITRATVYAWIANNKLHAEHIAGRLCVVRDSFPAAKVAK